MLRADAPSLEVCTVMLPSVLLQARHFELSNESWKTNQAAQYAWALLDWAIAIKAVHQGALIGANGPAGRTDVGDKDQGVPWSPQLLTGPQSTDMENIANIMLH